MIRRLRKTIGSWSDYVKTYIAPLRMKGEDATYLRLIKKSGLFDRDFYRKGNPQLMPLYLRFPERHFIRWGEAAGLFPNPNFSPRAYLRLNADFFSSDRSGPLLSRPFFHYIQHGYQSERPCLDPSPLDQEVQLPAIRPMSRQAVFAVVAHVYYPKLWRNLFEAVSASGIEVDWVITITDQGRPSQKLYNTLSRELPNAQIVLMPNHGRDIFPWVHVLNADILSGYSAVLKIHTKKSPHLTHGEQWRDKLLRGLLPKDNLQEQLEAFINDPNSGLLAPSDQFHTGARWWGSNRERARALVQRVGIELEDHVLEFPAGSMFWVKPQLISLMKSIGLSSDDFEREDGATDGTTAHAFERIIGHLAGHQGLRMTRMKSRCEEK